MKRTEVEAAIRACVGGRIHWRSPTEIHVEPVGSYETFSFSYDALAKLTTEIGTTAIDFRGDTGWDGTEVTPGDPASMSLCITLRKPAE